MISEHPALTLQSSCITSSWLTTLPIKEEECILNRQSFWDLVSDMTGN